MSWHLFIGPFIQCCDYLSNGPIMRCLTTCFTVLPSPYFVSTNLNSYYMTQAWTITVQPVLLQTTITHISGRTQEKMYDSVCRPNTDLKGSLESPPRDSEEEKAGIIRPRHTPGFLRQTNHSGHWGSEAKETNIQKWTDRDVTTHLTAPAGEYSLHPFCLPYKPTCLRTKF